MKRGIYSLVIIAPLLFIACDGQNGEQPAPKQTIQQNSSQTVTGQTNQTVTASSNAKMKYINDKRVLDKGLLHINTFIGSLKPTLKSMLSQDKTHATAMGACSSIAMQMTNEYNSMTTDNTKIRRTSLRYRSPANKPDSIDKDVMYRLQAIGDFKPVAVMVGDKYRVYKPLKTQKSCLLCHGDTQNMTPEVKRIIKARYPNDMAIGFKEGDMRGVVVAEFPK